MEKNMLSVFLLIFVFQFKVFAQPQPFKGTLLFNLTDKENLIIASELETKNIRFLSDESESKLRYDIEKRAFSITTNGSDHKMFAIIYKKDTTFIDYPSLPYLNFVFIKTPIPLNGKSFSFYNDYIYDALHSNYSDNSLRDFYLCQGCFISLQYGMTDKHRKQINKKQFIYEIKLEN